GQNLISRPGGAPLLEKMILEAAAVALDGVLVPPILDIGSGAGLPGIPIACLLPTTQVDLLERRGARCDFLRRECRSLPLPRTRVLEADAETLGQDEALRGRYGTVLLKAVAEPVVALGLARPFLRPDGRALLFRGLDWRPEPLDEWSYGGAHRAGPRLEPSSDAVVHIFSGS
ncbi:MAG: hypothetical protein HKO53_02435, partial [Gemmatimonadetes bacterium]|nr:hypothetical protein [Gemmatimonadota bacterium]